MGLVLDEILEIIIQGIGIAVFLTVGILVLVGRLILDRRILPGIIGGDAVEVVIRLDPVVKAALNLQVEVVDDMPGDGPVHRPVLAETAGIVVCDGLQRGYVVSVILFHVAFGIHGENGERSILYGMFEAAVA